MPRLVSFLPAATEMVFALGLGDQLVGVSHECDYPAAAKTKPVVVKPTLPLESMSLREIDVAVAARIGSGGNLYQVDEQLLTTQGRRFGADHVGCNRGLVAGSRDCRALRLRPRKSRRAGPATAAAAGLE